MRQNKNFTLKKISDIYYLLPVGQMVADQRRGMQLNETGVYLWQLLETEQTLDSLTQSCRDYFEIPDEDLPQLKDDISSFIAPLLQWKIILASDIVYSTQTPYYKTMNIAGLNCNLHGPKEVFTRFSSFFTKTVEHPDLTIDINPILIQIHENGSVILRTNELMILDCDDKYIIVFFNHTSLKEIHLSKDASFATLYAMPPYTPTACEEIFHGIRPVYLYLAQKHHMVAIHSASIFYQEKGWLFSASSGTGKSTQAALWKQYKNCPTINGDLNLLSIKNNTAVIHGTPWCGTSEIFDCHTYPLGGIILLSRSSQNHIEELTDDQKRLSVLQRIVSPSWNETLLTANLNLVNEIVTTAPVCRLHCTPDKGAVDTLSDWIDTLEITD